MVTCSDIFVRTEIVMLLHLWGPRVTYGDKMPVANEFGGMFETQNVFVVSGLQVVVGAREALCP